MAETTFLGTTCSHRYIVITILLIIFGFLLYMVQYEDIGSKFQISTFRFNFGMTKHTFNVKEYHFRNGIAEVIGSYSDVDTSKDDVIIYLKNMPVHKESDSSKMRSDLTNPTNIKLQNVTLTSTPKSISARASTVTTSPPTSISVTTTITAHKTSSSSRIKGNNKSRKLPDKHLFRKSRTIKSINCSKLFDGDEEEQDKARHIMDKPKSSMLPEMYANLTRDCILYKSIRGYITSSLTKEEENFPLAYSILVFKDIQQVERLLRAIYRPQNYYCIHVDEKSKTDFRNAIGNISSCFENVFITSKSVNVQWGTFTVLEPELICLQELWKYKKWKYFINLTGQEFPLRTNYELVKILKIYNGSNDMEGTVNRANKNRWEKAGPAPHGITPTKGSVHITANRDFIDYVLHNQTAKDFLEWVKKVDVPDETFFTSLNHNPQLKIPGSYTGEPETDPVTKPFLTRFKNWGIPPFNWDCHGQRVRLICVFGIGDLPLLSKRPEFFANKFYNFYEPLALDCLEELHYNRTRDEYFNRISFNTTFYENLEFIKKKI